MIKTLIYLNANWYKKRVNYFRISFHATLGDFFDDFFQLTGNPQQFEAFDSRYNFQYAVVSRSELRALHKYLDRSEQWQLVYADPIAGLFLKNKRKKQKLDFRKNQ